MCGFVQSTFVSTPFTTNVLLPSNSAEKEWCASAGTVDASIADTDTATPQALRPIIVTSSLRSSPPGIVRATVAPSVQICQDAEVTPPQLDPAPAVHPKQ